jgi:hypothetical protein
MQLAYPLLHGSGPGTAPGQCNSLSVERPVVSSGREHTVKHTIWRIATKRPSSAMCADGGGDAESATYVLLHKNDKPIVSSQCKVEKP